MNTEQLGTYLNDHLAGSEAALQLIARLVEDYPDTELADTMRGLHAEIEEEQQGLRQLVDRVAGDDSAIKQVTGWVSEKLTRLKLGTTTGDPLALFEAAGARVLDPACGACIGAGPGVSSRPTDVTVSAGSRNFPGRSGPGRVYLASPLVVAASALAGQLALPPSFAGGGA